MIQDKQNLNKRIKVNIRKNLISGVFIAIPFVVSILIIQWLFNVMAGFLRPALENILPKLMDSVFHSPVPDTYLRLTITALSVILLVLLLYFTGITGQFVIGKRLIELGEQVFMQIPIIRTVFISTRQVIQSVSLPDRTMFKSVVLVEFPRAGMKSLGFLTGYIRDNKGAKYCKIFIPTTPNPTTGYFEIVPFNDVLETNITIEEGFKMIISGGVVAPDTFEGFELDQAASIGQDKTDTESPLQKQNTAK